MHWTDILEVIIISLMAAIIIRKLLSMMRARTKEMKTKKMSEIKDISESKPTMNQIPQTMVPKGVNREQGGGNTATMMLLQQIMRFAPSVWE